MEIKSPLGWWKIGTRLRKIDGSWQGPSLIAHLLRYAVQFRAKFLALLKGQLGSLPGSIASYLLPVFDGFWCGGHLPTLSPVSRSTTVPSTVRFKRVFHLERGLMPRCFLACLSALRII